MDSPFNLPNLDPSSLPGAFQQVLNDPKAVIQYISLDTRFGALTFNPFAPNDPPVPGTPQSNTSGDSGAMNALGVAALRILRPRLIVMTVMGPIVRDLTP